MKEPKNFYDLTDKERKKIMKEAFEGAEKKQRELVEKYDHQMKRKNTVEKHWTKKKMERIKKRWANN